MRIADVPKGPGKADTENEAGNGETCRSIVGTNRTFASLRLKVRLRADSGRSVPNVSFRAENRRYSRGR